MASDEQAIRECVQWPCTFLGAERAESIDDSPYPRPPPLRIVTLRDRVCTARV
jgi:hypothetical protein